MNIQANDLPSDVAVQSLVAGQALAAVRSPEDKTQAALDAQNGQEPGQGQAQPQGGTAVTRQDAEKLTKQAQDYFGSKGVNLNFKVLDVDGGIQVEVLDAKTQKVLRKIPGDDMVQLSENLKRMAKGVMNKAV